MCSDFRRLEEEIELYEKRGIEYLHIDVMDGHFVPNITMGPPVIQALASMTRMKLDMHLMVSEPNALIPVLGDCGESVMTVHVEANPHLDRTLSLIRSCGSRSGVALNPATPVAMIEPVLGQVDLVLVMTVNPGFSGQEIVPYTIDKIAQVRRALDERGSSIPIEVDGNTTFDNIRKMVDAGADLIVAGTSCLYREGRRLEDSLDELEAFLATL
jgi:ribulose-phosphate 3-epimerase